MTHDYKSLMTEDYTLVLCFGETGEVRTSHVPLDEQDPYGQRIDFDAMCHHHFLELIGEFIVDGVTPVTIYWCYERDKMEYHGGHTFESVDELRDFVKWWRNI